jgi:glutamate N-acetyltransferase/amino-acid N-acetyltransferase
MAELHLLSPGGFSAAGIHAGLKSTPKPDVGLLVADAACSAAAIFTTNRVAAAPVIVGRDHVASGRLSAVVVNSGNANACTGNRGRNDALAMCRQTAAAVGCDAEEVLPSSTGIIGHLLPMKKISAGIASAAAKLGSSPDHALAFTDAIMTTDTRRKSAAAACTIARCKFIVAGVCKGSGMIGPRLAATTSHATMLAYITTDVSIAPALLRGLLADASEASFNAVTVDDHCSTNDTVCVMASGRGPVIRTRKHIATFAGALGEVCRSLAWQIAADGEGATKVVQIDVRNAARPADAKSIARGIANSPLVKCAMHGNDPNWGRIISAAGYSASSFDPEQATLRLQGTPVFRRGRPLPFSAAALSKRLAADRVLVDLDCGTGSASATVYTCDLSREYIRINADYHT